MADESRKQKESVVVTGASGFLGGRVCHALVEQGAYHVKAFVRASSSLQELPSTGVELVYGDITDTSSLLHAFQGCSAVLHCAALVTPWTPNPSKLFTVNVDGLKNVVKAIRGTSTVSKLVYVSSFFAIGPTDGKVVDESQMHPGDCFCTEYEKSKVLADAIALEEAKNNLPIVVVYPGVIYGPGKVTEGNALVSLVKERCNGRLPGKIGKRQDQFSFCHVDDVAKGCVAAMNKGRIGERYLLTGENTCFNEVFSLVDSLRGQKSLQFEIPMWSLEMVGWLSVFWARVSGSTPNISPPMVRVFKKQWCYSHEKAKRELGYESRPLKEGVAQFLTWMESSGHIPKQ
ncbi:hypothetical protein GOP47_0000857 [Adiantum capillus-veneris]|uniref:NAD-dependent epimerase/dehydratase domain-containing protein n=1 Tax=Adiantum capillus-veneris TaxID=13818 RepID=A0A9D4VEB4_ADICA|nr:hypothetical protein GOP47_0000857 [Adiantum capillus-veneris]